MSRGRDVSITSVSPFTFSEPNTVASTHRRRAFKSHPNKYFGERYDGIETSRPPHLNIINKYINQSCMSSTYLALICVFQKVVWSAVVSGKSRDPPLQWYFDGTRLKWNSIENQPLSEHIKDLVKQRYSSDYDELLCHSKFLAQPSRQIKSLTKI